jgi:hypothetical protein
MLKKILLAMGLTAFIFLGRISVSYAWGFWAHKQINHCAVFTLPEELKNFYKKNIDFVTEHAVDPDKRRSTDKKEGPRHYIDADHYGKNPFDVIPKNWDKAVAKFSQDTLEAYGVNPWVIADVTKRLTRAFAKGNKDSILVLSADLGHYVADAHVPLHTSENYDGQLTNQKGIHSFWETRLPELYGDSYNFYAGEAHYIEYPLSEGWKIIRASFSSLDSVLKLESRLNDQFPKDKKFMAQKKGDKVFYDFSEEYSKQYHEMLNHMVERQMRAAIVEVGSFWYTAWVNAGKPDLRNMDRSVMDDDTRENLDWE